MHSVNLVLSPGRDLFLYILNLVCTGGKRKGELNVLKYSIIAVSAAFFSEFTIFFK